MFEILCTILFVWLFIKVFGLVFKVAWSLTKVFATILFCYGSARTDCLLYICRWPSVTNPRRFAGASICTA